MQPRKKKSLGKRLESEIAVSASDSAWKLHINSWEMAAVIVRMSWSVEKLKHYRKLLQNLHVKLSDREMREKKKRFCFPTKKKRVWLLMR